MNRAMALDAVVPTTPVPTAPPFDKVRLRFRKGGDLRLLSHHDLMRCFERMLRRAALPVRATQGFHPKPRLVFALSLPLGVVGCEEIAELELTEFLPPDEVRDRLARQAPPGLQVLSLCRIGPKESAQVRALIYRIALPPERAAELMAAPEQWVERTRPPVRRLDIRPFLRDLRLPSPADESNPIRHLEFHLWLTPEGTARPEEVLAALGFRDLLDAGAVLERVRLELADETPAPFAKGIA
jgi:radical SAM-linked protein